MYQCKQTDLETSYCAVSKRYYTREMGVYDSYDIILTEDSHVIYELHDLSDDTQWVNSFVELLNTGNVSPVHVKDLAMDLLP
ncbi:MAG: DUF6514 family protein [Oscillospiraceae bacterium]